MCGIVGFWGLRDFHRLREGLTEAVARLTHRGPDDSGLFLDEVRGVGLGHCRLSILDLSWAGHQPMATDDGAIQIVYNGEIYNFKEIRKTLKKMGHTFRTETDTEVILKAYLQWGMDCLHRFVGMFAFGLYDKRKGLLFLVRDRLGIKPLYYGFHKGTLLFASELKGLMAFEGFERSLDLDALASFLHYQYVPAPKTIFQHTFKLLPGHYLIYDGQVLKTSVYWTLPGLNSTSQAEDCISEKEAVEELERLLLQAVSDRLVSDVPLGALLSGGIDSSTVVLLMQKAHSGPVKTFTIGFEEATYNEAPWASRIAKHLGTDHTEFYVTPKETMGVIPSLPEIYDEPFGDSSAIPTYWVSRLARSQVTVALSGDGGDEQFAGYVRYWATQSMVNAFQGVPWGLRKALASLLGFIPSPVAQRVYLLSWPWLPHGLRVANFPDKWQKLISLLGQSQVEELYRMTICLWPKGEILGLMGRDVQEAGYEKAFRETRDWPLLSRLMRVDQKTYLPDAMLTKVDRASMAVGLEVRVPLLDHRVVEFSARLPDGLKYRDGTAKVLLKRLLAKYIPKSLLERPKMGFAIPMDQWLRRELKGLLQDYLSGPRLKQEGLFDDQVVIRKVEEHLEGTANHQHRLWTLLMWEMWRDKWLR